MTIAAPPYYSSCTAHAADDDRSKCLSPSARWRSGTVSQIWGNIRERVSSSNRRESDPTRRWRKRPKIVEKAKAAEGPLMSLPIELVQLIATFLPLSSQATLALTSHSMLSTIGGESWQALRLNRHKDEKRVFLAHIENKFPKHRLCNRCARLHPRDDVEGPFEWEVLPVRKCVEKEGCIHFIGFYFLYFHLVQLAMSRYLLGPAHGISLNTFYYLYQEKSADNNYCTHVEVNARIASGEFLLEARHRLFWYRRGYKNLQSYLDHLELLRPCPHLKVDSNYNASTFYDTRIGQDFSLGERIACRLDHLNEEGSSCERCCGLGHCQFCPTDYRVEVYDRGVGGLELVLLVWMNLGSGRTPLDPKWQSHVHGGFNKFGPFNAFPYEPGSVRRAYHEAEGLPHGSASSALLRVSKSRAASY
ncbi:hypothetical protein BJ546DRAFT_57593 [Cryomyces antarcticus]